jgi:hypothetical protein
MGRLYLPKRHPTQRGRGPASGQPWPAGSGARRRHAPPDGPRLCRRVRRDRQVVPSARIDIHASTTQPLTPGDHPGLRATGRRRDKRQAASQGLQRRIWARVVEGRQHEAVGSAVPRANILERPGEMRTRPASPRLAASACIAFSLRSAPTMTRCARVLHAAAKARSNCGTPLRSKPLPTKSSKGRVVRECRPAPASLRGIHQPRSRVKDCGIDAVVDHRQHVAATP